MMLDARKTAVAVVLLVAAAGSWWLSQRVTKPQPVAKTGLRHEPDYVIGDFTSWAYDERGQRRYRLSAVRLAHYPDDDTSRLDSPYLIQFGNGAPVHTRADHGVLSDNNSRILMTGHVRSARGRDPKGAAGEIVSDRMLIRLAR